MQLFGSERKHALLEGIQGRPAFPIVEVGQSLTPNSRSLGNSMIADHGPGAD
jgi:hypothetical protein